MKIIGGRTIPGTETVGAYVAAIFPGGIADQLHGELREGKGCEIPLLVCSSISIHKFGNKLLKQRLVNFVSDRVMTKFHMKFQNEHVNDIII